MQSPSSPTRRRGAAVEVGARDAKGIVAVTVSDEGEGVRSEDATRIFDPFLSTKGSVGTGLGLTVSLGIVRGYGGDIRVSTAPGGGATFEVLLLSYRSAQPSEQAKDP